MGEIKKNDNQFSEKSMDDWKSIKPSENKIDSSSMKEFLPKEPSDIIHFGDEPYHTPNQDLELPNVYLDNDSLRNSQKEDDISIDDMEDVVEVENHNKDNYHLVQNGKFDNPQFLRDFWSKEFEKEYEGESGKESADENEDNQNEKLKGENSDEKEHNYKKKQSGGSYKDLKKDSDGEKEEIHHIPADSTNDLPYKDGPAIRMDKEDHKKTASYGNSKEAREYRAKQKELIDKGKFREAVQMDIDDLKSKFGNKYDDAIKEMNSYIDKLESEGRI